MGRSLVAREADRLAERLLQSFGSEDSVWWVHNYHLGKNVVFTRALLEVIYAGRPQRIILQIHDFPECGRFTNLRLLREAVSRDPYPLSPWVRYAVLTGRDRDILVRAGIPENGVFLLENPVHQRRDSRQDRRKSIRKELHRQFGNAFPRFDPGAPLLLYPIRTIRRKNVLEALLLCLLVHRNTNILITLPGISDAERRYSDLVRGLFADRIAPGLWGIGTGLEERGLTFEDLVSASDLVISTSVQEGFGYLFINSLLWSLPLMARNLATLSGLKDLFCRYPAHFYDSLRVPVPKPIGLAAAYRRKIKALDALVSPGQLDRLLARVDDMVRDDRVDFSYLPVEAQDAVLREIAEGADRGPFEEENGATLGRLREMLAGGRSEANARGGMNTAEIEGRFGASAYAENFRGILESFGADLGRNPKQLHSRGKEISGAVLQAFLELEQLRLLYDF